MSAAGGQPQAEVDPIQDVQMHAPPTMKSDGGDVYVWIEPDEKFLTVWMGGNRWLTCAVIAEHDSAGDSVRAMKALGVKETA